MVAETGREKPRKTNVTHCVYQSRACLSALASKLPTGKIGRQATSWSAGHLSAMPRTSGKKVSLFRADTSISPGNLRWATETLLRVVVFFKRSEF